MDNKPDMTAHQSVLLRCEDDTMRLAEQIWQISRVGDVIALWGDLGVGKTAFARGFIRAATRPAEEVPSPTFTLLQTYGAPPGLIYHFDCYRIEHEDEVLELGIDDAFADGISLIEWPGNMGRWLPDRRLDLELASLNQDTSRTAILTGDLTWQARLVALDLHW